MFLYFNNIAAIGDGDHMGNKLGSTVAQNSGGHEFGMGGDVHFLFDFPLFSLLSFILHVHMYSLHNN